MALRERGTADEAHDVEDSIVGLEDAGVGHRRRAGRAAPRRCRAGRDSPMRAPAVAHSRTYASGPPGISASQISWHVRNESVNARCTHSISSGSLAR